MHLSKENEDLQKKKQIIKSEATTSESDTPSD